MIEPQKHVHHGNFENFTKSLKITSPPPLTHPPHWTPSLAPLTHLTPLTHPLTRPPHSPPHPPPHSPPSLTPLTRPPHSPPSLAPLTRPPHSPPHSPPSLAPLTFVPVPGFIFKFEIWPANYTLSNYTINFLGILHIIIKIFQCMKFYG